MNEATNSLAGCASSVLGRAVLGDLAALLHDRDPVAEQDGLVDVVGDEDDGLAEVALEALELLLERAAADGVDGAERLVHQQHGRVGGERAGDPDALLLAARELARVAVRHVLLEPDELDQLERAGALALAVPAEQPRDGGDVVGDRAVREQPGLLDDVADPPPELVHGHLADVLAVELDRAAGGLDQAVDHPQRGRLPAARRAQQHGDLAAGHLQAQVADGDGPVRVPLRDVVERDQDVKACQTRGPGVGLTSDPVKYG